MDRVALRFHRRGVEHVDDHVATLDMSKEVEAEPLAFGRAGDEPGNISHREAELLLLNHPEVRRESRKRVIRNLRTRRTHRGDERTFTRTREAHEGDIGDRLHLENEGAFLTWFA